MKGEEDMVDTEKLERRCSKLENALERFARQIHHSEDDTIAFEDCYRRWCYEARVILRIGSYPSAEVIE